MKPFALEVKRGARICGVVGMFLIAGQPLTSIAGELGVARSEVSGRTEPITSEQWQAVVAAIAAEFPNDVAGSAPTYRFDSNRLYARFTDHFTLPLVGGAKLQFHPPAGPEGGRYAQIAERDTNLVHIQISVDSLRDGYVAIPADEVVKFRDHFERVYQRFISHYGELEKLVSERPELGARMPPAVPPVTSYLVGQRTPMVIVPYSFALGTDVPLPLPGGKTVLVERLHNNYYYVTFDVPLFTEAQRILMKQYGGYYSMPAEYRSLSYEKGFECNDSYYEYATDPAVINDYHGWYGLNDTPEATVVGFPDGTFSVTRNGLDQVLRAAAVFDALPPEIQEQARQGVGQ